MNNQSKVNSTKIICTCDENNEDILWEINEKYSEAIKDRNGKVVSSLLCIEFIYIKNIKYRNKDGDDTDKRTYKHAFLTDFSLSQYNNGNKVASWDIGVFARNLKRIYYLCSTSS